MPVLSDENVYVKRRKPWTANCFVHTIIVCPLLWDRNFTHLPHRPAKILEPIWRLIDIDYR